LLDHEDPSNLIDDGGKNLLKEKLVEVMMHVSNSGQGVLTNLMIEMISTMGRKFLQNDWPQLFPNLISSIKNSQDISNYRTVFECVKKICKKYRYMFRSDALYLEMNYVIENLSVPMLETLCNCLNMAKDPANDGNEQLIRTLYGVMNSILHIMESILGQEELPDFYEENLKVITDACAFILTQDYPKLQKVP
jgi:exportin-2 (importin alpha re-exporter)